MTLFKKISAFFVVSFVMIIVFLKGTLSKFVRETHHSIYLSAETITYSYCFVFFFKLSRLFWRPIFHTVKVIYTRFVKNDSIPKKKVYFFLLLVIPFSFLENANYQLE